MQLAQSIKKAYDTKWAFVNSFGVQIIIPDKMKQEIWPDFDSRDIELNIISCSTPQLTNNTIEIFQADKWSIHNGRDELYRFNMTFRDEDQLRLYRKFVSLYKNTKDSYFNDVALIVNIYKDADWLGEEQEKLLWYLEGVLIESVSQIDFNTTTENQVTEFSVSFKCREVVIADY